MSSNRLNRIIQTLSHRQEDVSVLLDEVHKPHNLSAIIRTCDAVGIPNVHAFETPDQELRTFKNAAAGSEKWVNLDIHNNKKSLIENLKNSKRQILAAHLSNKAVSYRDIDFTKPTTIIMGAEKWGVSEEIANLADHHVIVPMHGLVESLNVSVAAAIILFELERQRDLAGMYKLKTPEQLCKKQIFEWMQPKMAKLCNLNHWKYPEIDEDGDMVSPSKWYQERLNKNSNENKKNDK